MFDRSSMTWLGVEDFFNYYLPGLLWSTNLYFLLAMLYPALIIIVTTQLGKIDQLLLVAVALLLPYTIGIIASFLGSVIHGIDKVLLGKPEEYVLNSEKKKGIGKIRFGSSLGKGLARQIQKIATSKFGSDLSSGSLYFNVHYSLQLSPFPRIQSHVARITNLLNLHEGLISPIIFGTVFAFFASRRLDIVELNIIGLILLAIALGLWYRYHYLREVRAKHVYRYFLLWQTIGKEADSELKKALQKKVAG
jgi:hypothetical protein